MYNKIYYESDKERYKQRSHDYYYNNKEHILRCNKNKYDDLSKEEKDANALYGINWYNNLTEDKKNIKREYAKNRYHSLPNDKMLQLKERKKEYQRKYREMKKAQGKLAKNAVLTS